MGEQMCHCNQQIKICVDWDSSFSTTEGRKITKKVKWTNCGQKNPLCLKGYRCSHKAIPWYNNKYKRHISQICFSFCILICIAGVLLVLWSMCNGRESHGNGRRPLLWLIPNTVYKSILLLHVTVTQISAPAQAWATLLLFISVSLLALPPDPEQRLFRC